MPIFDFGLPALEAEFWRWMFLMVRVGAALMAAPLFGGVMMPREVRLILTAAIALLIAGWTDAQAPLHLASFAGGMAVTGEVTVGLALGFVLQFAFAAPVIAAEIIGGGMGLGLAASIDPIAGAQSPVLGQYFTMMLTVIFLGIGGHIQWIALVIRSYDVFPPGHVLGAVSTGGYSIDHFRLALSFASAMFTTAVMIALPISLVLLLVQALTGVISRAAPALNLFALGMPAGIIAGAMALIASLPLITDHMTQISLQAVDTVSRMMAP